MKVILFINSKVSYRRQGDRCRQRLHGVFYKFGFVLIPRESHDGTNKLRNWDMWGPFLMCLVFGLFINSNFLYIQRLNTVHVAFFLSFYRSFGCYLQYASPGWADLIFSVCFSPRILPFSALCCIHGTSNFQVRAVQFFYHQIDRYYCGKLMEYFM